MKKFGNLSLDDLNNKWVINDTEPHVNTKLKNIFKGIKETSRPPFRLSRTKEMDADLKWFIQRYPLEISERDLSILNNGSEEYFKFLNDTEKFFVSEYQATDKVLKNGKTLYNYQAVGRDFFHAVGRVLLADEVGLGKTIIAIASILDKKFLPAVIVVQPHLIKQWEDQIKDWSDLKVLSIHDRNARPIIDADVYLLKYSNAGSWLDYLIEKKPQTLILDEVQEVRRTESIKHESCRALEKVVNYVIALSGSPIYNYGSEIWNVYQCIKPSIFGTDFEFNLEWCGLGKIVKDPKALGSYLRDSRAYLRRTKEDVKSEIPPVNRIVHTVEYNQKDIDKIEKEAKVLARIIDQGSFIEKGQASRELNVMIRKATGVSKARGVASYVKVILNNNEPVVLSGWHRDVYDIWKEELKEYNPVFYTGSETLAQKEEAKKKFINGETNLFILSLRSGMGLDGIQARCSYVVIGELDWSPSIHNQVIGRLYRHGQTKQVTAIFLISDSGSDPVVVDILGLKKAQSEAIFDPLAENKDVVSNDSIIKEFAKRLLNKTNISP